MPPQIRVQGATVVVVGNFNPAIYHPAWFAANNLVRQQEADAAKLEVIHPEVAAFSAEWLQINSTRDRFQATTTQEAFYERLRDLVMGVLDLLSHTPVSAIGLNQEFHYWLPSEEYWHNIGHRLAPKSEWSDILHQPGMRSLIMEGQRPDGYAGFIRVNVEPSVRVEPGIFVTINDHYQLNAAALCLRVRKGPVAFWMSIGPLPWRLVAGSPNISLQLENANERASRSFLHSNPDLSTRFHEPKEPGLVCEPHSVEQERD